ncbi:hypothetical protein F5B20DRAFT_579173 [Whalleya microplaca]|nr:hypothetical protein F5B20DRAFT_579173 [Whalleya microplaca]
MLFDKSNSFLFQLPREIFDEIVEYVEDPRDFLRLASTSNALWNMLETDWGCVARDAEMLRRWIEQGRNPHNSYYSMLNWCLDTHQSIDVVRRIVEVYLEVYPEAIRMGMSWDFISLAIGRGHRDIVQMLYDIGQGPDIERVNDPLGWAILSNQLEIVECLIDNGMVATDDDIELASLMFANLNPAIHGALQRSRN